MIYLVDNTIDGQGASPREIQAALRKIAPEQEILMEPFSRVSLARVQDLRPSHIVLSGQSHPWNMYSREALAGVFEIIHDASQPLLGVCGGHQQIALAFGARVDLMERIEPGEGYEGAKRERGFHAVHTEGDALFENLPDSITVWQSHCDEVKELPPAFRLTASNQTSRIQAMQHESRPLFGVQFHPELFDDEHPQGRVVLENFLRL